MQNKVSLLFTKCIPFLYKGSLPCLESRCKKNVEKLKVPPFKSTLNTRSPTPNGVGLLVVGEDGFEPSKRYAADLQSVPFGHSGTPPYSISVECLSGAGRRTRTPDLLITNQLLYQLSYTGGSNRTCLLYRPHVGLSSIFSSFSKKAE